MNSMQLVKFDVLSILKSPLTYIAIVLGTAPAVGITMIMVAQDIDVEAYVILSVLKWFFSIIGMLFVVKTITRDSGQGTIQLYLNSVRNRLSYLIAKTVSIVFISLIVTGVVLLVTYLVQWSINGMGLKTSVTWQLFIFYLMLFLIYGLLLFLINLFVQKSSLVFSLGILLLLVYPIVTPFIPFIPQIGEKIMEALGYIPIGYLTEKTLSDDITFTNVQWLINIASLAVLMIGNALLITKKDI
ncbi:phenol-soluble modulin export ABC transporter permease subunit PmtD [Staphylococcus americanisciuri]|uniref:ABC transporter permease subunit n=1 Tax=Staphylococcus americanisciuri TaxID=2973940 RepID=A0ABT2F3C4_9STAP|nr:ABC transporter permease subunit [Staphylococcus americanisciuri]MCS4486936.1 ABC transporter permease subunit [Staphylococcus americanisciuri]